MNYKNILTTFTHGSYHVPFYLSPFLKSHMKKDNNRLLKNFSDFATYYLSENIDDKNKIVCNFSRALWDPNRSLDSSDLFRTCDFNSIEIWKVKIPKIIRKILINKYYIKYHHEIENKIALLKKEYWSVIHLDIHDTWNILMWKSKDEDKMKEQYFPEINIMNIENSSCDINIAKKIGDVFTKEYWHKANIDDAFWWGWFVSRKNGIWDKDVNSVRIEFWRYLFMDEKTQKIDCDKMEIARKNFEKVILELTKIQTQH